jgi:4-hydroxy-2-oxoheptanedioate aldolase
MKVFGVPGGSDSSQQEFMEVVENICVIGKKLGKPVGSMGTGEDLSWKRTKQEMEFLLISFDYNALINGFKIGLENTQRRVECVVKL